MSMTKSEPYTIWVEDCPHGNHIYHYKVNDFEFKNEMIRSDCPECKCIRIYKLKNYVAEYEDGYKIVVDTAYLFVDSDYGQCITAAYDKNDDSPLVDDMHWSVHFCDKYDEIYEVNAHDIHIIFNASLGDMSFGRCEIKADIECKGTFGKGFTMFDLETFIEDLRDGYIEDFEFTPEE